MEKQTDGFHTHRNALGAIGTALLLSVAALWFFFGQAKPAEAAEPVAQPNGTAEFVVNDTNGHRTCDIYTSSDEASLVEQAKAYAKETGCKFSVWYKNKVEALSKDDQASDKESAITPVIPQQSAKELLPATPKQPEVAISNPK